jgi:FkbM family methyltransferase
MKDKESNKTFYSQNGEDFLLDKIFQGIDKGFFVEVGCVDGKRFSNTLYFEKKGWSGLCIEAHNDYIDHLKKNRQNSKIIHCAVGATNNRQVSFYADKRGSLSSLDNFKAEELKRDYPSFTGFTKQRVPQKNLNTIFEENAVENIHILSIDIEGGEFEALKGIDFSKYKPRVLVIEFDSISYLQKLKNNLRNEGYISGPIIGTNIFFSRKKDNMEKISGNNYGEITLIHTGNSLMDEEDKKVRVKVDTTLLSKYKKLTIMAVMPLVHWLRNILGIYD